MFNRSSVYMASLTHLHLNAFNYRYIWFSLVINWFSFGFWWFNNKTCFKFKINNILSFYYLSPIAGWTLVPNRCCVDKRLTQTDSIYYLKYSFHSHLLFTVKFLNIYFYFEILITSSKNMCTLYYFSFHLYVFELIIISSFISLHIHK